LAFSAKKDVPRDLQVLLYQVQTGPSRERRRAEVIADVEAHGLQNGFERSCRFFTASEAVTVEQVAARHGFLGPETILVHFNNRGFVAFGDGVNLAAGEVIFIPQIRELPVVPIGPLMSVTDVSESVPNDGHRHEARWSIQDNDYDPLDPEAWAPESLMQLGPGYAPRGDVDDIDKGRLWLPQFAVIDALGKCLAVSPTPPEIVQDAQYKLEDRDPHAFMVVAHGESKFLDAGQQNARFGLVAQPIASYGALDEQQIAAHPLLQPELPDFPSDFGDDEEGTS
jgi:hypothetical protein